MVVWGGVNCVLDVGNISRETLVRICVDDTVRGSVMLLLWLYIGMILDCSIMGNGNVGRRVLSMRYRECFT